MSLNVERSLHLDVIRTFLEEQQADVVCFQELYERDIPFFESFLGPCVVYGHDGVHPADPPEQGSQMEGAGIFTKLPVTDAAVSYYVGSQEHARSRESKTIPDDKFAAACTVEQDGEPFRILTTHFTWTRDGLPTDEQRSDLQALLRLLEREQRFILCGDLNAPRGGEVFSTLASKYKDNIPVHYTTSIDKGFHRAGDLQLMVDGLFTTPEYIATNVALCSGVSDHLAITAMIAKK